MSFVRLMALLAGVDLYIRGENKHKQMVKGIRSGGTAGTTGY